MFESYLSSALREVLLKPTEVNNIDLLAKSLQPYLWDNGSYNFLHLEIKLKQTASKKALIQEKEQASCFVTLVHEYIHYLQNFSTTWGFTNFITYVDFFAAFFGDNILLDTDPSLPLKGGQIDSKFGAKSYSNYLKSAFLGIAKGTDGKFQFQATNDANFTIVESTIEDPYWGKEVYIAYVALDKKLIPLNELVISENMAIVASYLASGLTLEETRKTISSIWGPQYHVIYSFTASLFPNKNCLKITYLICEVSLLIPPYNKKVVDILKFLNDQQLTFNNNTEAEINEAILTYINFNKALDGLMVNINRQLESRILTFGKYKDQYEFYKFLIVVLNLFKVGFAKRVAAKHTYCDRMDLNFLNAYALDMFSPILIFADGQKSMLGNPPDDFINSIASFHGILKIFHQSYYAKIQKCPFFETHSICNVSKGTECENDATSIYGRPEYAGCIMDNALNVIGIKKLGRK